MAGNRIPPWLRFMQVPEATAAKHPIPLKMGISGPSGSALNAPGLADVLYWLKHNPGAEKLKGSVALGAQILGMLVPEDKAVVALGKAGRYAVGEEGLRDVERAYLALNRVTHGKLPPIDAISEPHVKQIAAWYDALQSQHADPVTRQGYRELMGEINDQADALKKAGYSWTVVDRDPYKTADQMMTGAKNTKHIFVNATKPGQEHPLLTNDENNTLRAVHDLWGHAKEGHAFNSTGEELARREHLASIRSPLARRAMATETGGQQAWYHFGPGNALDADFQNKFGVQKAALMPEHFMGDYTSFPEAVDAAAYTRRGNAASTSPSGLVTGNVRAPRSRVPNVSPSLDVPAILRKPKVTAPPVEVPTPSREMVGKPAIKGADGKFYTGLNHGDAMNNAAEAMRKTPEGMAAMRKNGGNAVMPGFDGYFETSHGRFVNRTKALGIARMNEQAPGLHPAHTELHSSDLKDSEYLRQQKGVSGTSMLPLVGGAAGGALTGAAVDPEHPVAGAFAGGLAGLGLGMGVGAAMNKGSRAVGGLRTLAELGERGALGTATSPKGHALFDALLPSEQSLITNRSIPAFEAAAQTLPSPKVFGAGAIAGKSKLGWYRNSAKALVDAYGPDAPRFAALLSALSPQQPVEANLKMAMDTWEAWDAVGRPTDPAAITHILDEIARATPEGKQMGSRVPNSLRALTSNDPANLVLSGPKVDSFHKNLMGDVHRVTLDTWMAQLGGLDPKALGGTSRGGVLGQNALYAAYSGRMRQTAEHLSHVTGRAWTPAEVQETLWSWGKALSERALPSSRGQHPGQIAMFGPTDLRSAIKGLAPEAIAGTPDFATLLNQSPYTGSLTRQGLPLPGAPAPCVGFACPAPDVTSLHALAKNIMSSRNLGLAR